MTTTINASPTNGLVATGDGSGVLKVQSNGVTTNALAWGSYAATGSATVPTLRSAYNISSITRNSAGNYTFAFTTAVTDANYSVSGAATYGVTVQGTVFQSLTKTTSAVTIQVGFLANFSASVSAYDYGVDFAIFGN